MKKKIHDWLAYTGAIIVGIVIIITSLAITTGVSNVTQESGVLLFKVLVGIIIILKLFF